VPGRVICQTRTVRLCRGTQATRKASVACHLKEKRHGAFRRLKVGPCNPLRTITQVSVAVTVVVVAVSEEAMVSVVAKRPRPQVNSSAGR
jgi:hypothetical protein